MSPIRHLVPVTSSFAPGAWSPLAMEVYCDMLDKEACSPKVVLPQLAAYTPPAWGLSGFFTPSDVSSESYFWDADLALTRSVSPASSDMQSISNMSMDELSSLLNEYVPVEHQQQRVNSLAEMDESTASAFLSHLTQQLESAAQADMLPSPVTSNEDAEADTQAELQYHLSTLKPTPTLASAPEPLFDDAVVGSDELPPRPPNAFILYRRHQQAHLRSERPGIHLHLASKLIAAWWKVEDPNTKEYYRRLAAEGRKELLKRFPDYKYRARTEQERAQAKKKKKERKCSADTVVSQEHVMYLEALSPYLHQ